MRPARLVLLSVAFSACLPGCHRKRAEPEQTPIVVRPAPPAPKELLAEGALGDVVRVWRSVRELLGGRVLAVPATYPLAVTTLVGASPFEAGLVDERAPLALAVLEIGGRPSACAAVRLTSGAEFVAALTTGTDARFEAEAHPAAAVTFLRPRGVGPGLAIAVAGDALVVAARRDVLDVAAAYVGRTLAPSLRESGGLSLVVPHRALAGPVAHRLDQVLSSWLDALASADAAGRAAHGRDPDFGDPRAIIRALTAFASGIPEVVASSSEARLEATLAGTVLEGRIELVPEATGRAAELVRDLPSGDAAPLGSLPDTTDVAILLRRAPSAAEQRPSLVSEILGDRLSPAERARFDGLAQDFERGAGPTLLVGASRGASRPAAFALGVDGEAKASTRLVRGIPAALGTPALVAPLSSHGIRIDASALPVTVNGAAEATGVRLSSRSTPSAPFSRLDVVAASAGSRTVVVVAPLGAGESAAALLADAPSPLSSDPAVLRVVSRAESNTGVVLFGRFGPGPGGTGIGALSVGTDRKLLRVELTLSEAAFRALFPLLVAPSPTPASP